MSLTSSESWPESSIVSRNIHQRQWPDKMKLLSDLCFQCIANNLNRIHRAGSYLAPVHKEVLIDRLVSHDQLTESYLPYITYNLFSNSLKHVNFYKCEQVTDSILKLLASSKCQLQWITIHGCPEITDVGIADLLQEQKCLECVELRKLVNLTGRGLQTLSSPCLEKLDFRGCNNLLSDGIKCVVSNNPTITSLNLSLCGKLDGSVFPAVARALSHNLEHLDLAGLNIPDDTSLSCIAQHCPNLKRLLLYGCNRVTDVGITKLFEHCQEIEALDLSYCSKIQTQSASECLRILPHTLQELNLCGVLVQDCDLLVESIQRLHRLKAVRFCGVPAINNETLEQILSVIGPSLEELDLSGGATSDHITDEGIAAIARHCRRLHTLALNLLRQISGVTLQPLFQNPDAIECLTSLLLSCKKLDPCVLHVVVDQCHNLQKLDLSGVNCVDDSLIVRLAEQCTRLKYINLKGCRQVTDVGVCELARKCPLTVAVLSGLNSLTDHSIFMLANSCPYMEEIYLSGCSLVTRAAIRYLQDSCIPRVFFYHKVPNASPAQLMARNLDTGQFCRVDII